MKPYTVLSLIFLIAISLLPPIDFFIKNPIGDKWFWMICIAGFFGVFTLFIKTNWFLRIIAIGGFLNCFFSCAPYISFTAYVILIFCCYFYIVACRIEDWTIVINCFKTILILNSIIILMQITGHDSLMNFGVGNILSHVQYLRVGIIGQHMQMASFSVILTSLLISVTPFFLIFPIFVSFLSHSSWGLISSFVGIIIYTSHKSIKISAILLFSLSLIAIFYMVKEQKISAAFAESGRISVWKRTVEITNQRPLLGWGIGTFKNVFPAISKLNCIPYAESHNCWLEIAFETGYLGMIFSIGIFSFLVIKLFHYGQYALLSGLVMIGTDMMGHFPTRQINCVPLLILFIAYCDSQMRKYECCSK